MHTRAFSIILGFLLLGETLSCRANPPADAKARAIYDHDKEWLSHFPAPFVASNIRGHGMEYAERRQAALDLVRQQRDFGVVSELTDALRENSFLSAEIIDILVDWKAKRALPVLKEVAKDANREKAVRDKARDAYDEISAAQPDRPPVY